MKLAEAQAVVIDRDGGRCVVCGIPVAEVHHRYRRGMGGTSDPGIHSPENLLCLCSLHHRETESNRRDSRYLNGRCVPTLDAARTTPVLTYAGWTLLTERGTALHICQPYAAASAGLAALRAVPLLTELGANGRNQPA